MLETWNDKLVAVALIVAWLPTGWMLLRLIEAARNALHSSRN